MRKTYRSATKLTFPLKLKGGKRHVKFEEQFYGYSTSDEEEQNAIEGSPHFKRGEIKLFKSVVEEGDKATKKPVVNPPAPIPPKKEDTKTDKVDLVVDKTDSGKKDETVVDPPVKVEEQTSTTEGSADANRESTDKIPEEGDKTEGFTDFPNVTDINGAVEVLRGEPYNVHHMKVRTPAAIQEQAILNKVTFSNWTVE